MKKSERKLGSKCAKVLSQSENPAETHAMEAFTDGPAPRSSTDGEISVGYLVSSLSVPVFSSDSEDEDNPLIQPPAKRQKTLPPKLPSTESRVDPISEDPTLIDMSHADWNQIQEPPELYYDALYDEQEESEEDDVEDTATWQQGDDPLQQVYVTDDDLPEDLRKAILAENARRQEQQRSSDRRRDAKNDDADQYFDADDVGDAALFPGDEDATRFDWRPMDTFQGIREPFLPRKTGPTTATQSAFEAFSQYWDEGVLTLIASETNSYAAFREVDGWYDTNIHEIMVLFAFWIMLGIVRLPSIKSCFSTHPLLNTSCFRIMFSRSRYERLCSCLRFNDCSLPKHSKTYDIISHLNSRFQAAYTPCQEISIDDSLTLWKGNLLFRQYIKTKSAKCGVKTFELCESATGYLWSFYVYAGKGSLPDPTLPASLLKSTATVISLIRPLLNKGYTLFMDNWFNSPLLTRFLKRNKTDVVGTLRSTRQNIPPLIKLCKLQPGQYAARHSGDMTVMAYCDKKMKQVTLISTYHGTGVAQSPSKRRQMIDPWKPQLVLDYNASIGEVDLKDSMLEAHLLERKRGARWEVKLLKRLLNCSILNSRICREVTTGKLINHTVFRLELVDQILKSHLSLVPKSRRSARPAAQIEPNGRFVGNRHWPSTVAKRLASGRIARRRCAECGKQTGLECSLCGVGLCLECFGRYHTKPSY